GTGPFKIISPHISLDSNFSRAKRHMVIHKPFYSSFSMSRLTEVFIESDDPMWHYGATDGRRLWINWNNVNAMTYEQIESFLEHEILHVVYGHHVMIKGRDPEVWNKATDYRINWDIRNEGGKLPDGVLYHPNTPNENSQVLYRMLKDKKKENQSWQKPGGKNFGSVIELMGPDGKPMTDVEAEK